MDNKTPVLSDVELVRWLRNCVDGGWCNSCPFRGVGAPFSATCINRLLMAAADRIERSVEK